MHGFIAWFVVFLSGIDIAMYRVMKQKQTNDNFIILVRIVCNVLLVIIIIYWLE